MPSLDRRFDVRLDNALDRRFEVRMGPELAQQLDELADQNNMTQGEVFRRAIVLYKLAKSVTNKKGKILLEFNDQVTREVVEMPPH